MWNQEDIKKYWHEQTKKGDNPCHYHNKWQDKYAFRIRTQAFKSSDFSGDALVVDFGCGVGDYTNALTKLSRARFIGFDFPFNVEIAQNKHKNPQITFIPKSLPDLEVKNAIKSADALVTTTVYVHLAPEVRGMFLEAISEMRQGSKVLILEYMPKQIPEFQRGLNYKEIETPDQVVFKFKAAGFRLKEMRHVNYLDSFLFFYLGRNIFSYYLTLFIEDILKLIKYPNSKYKLLIFEKMA